MESGEETKNQNLQQKTNYENIRQKPSQGSFSLLPELSTEQKGTVEKKENINLSSVSFIFIVTLLTVVILGANLYLRTQQNQIKNSITATTYSINSKRDVALLLKNISAKITSIEELKQNDKLYSLFVTDVLKFPSNLKVRTIKFLDSGDFLITGNARNVSEFEGLERHINSVTSFKEMNIDLLKVYTADEIKQIDDPIASTYPVSWTISGRYEKNIETETTQTTNQSTTENTSTE